MGKYMRKCVKGIGGEVAVMDVSPVAGGVRTRARAALSLAAAAALESAGTKRRKVDSGDQFCISYLQLRSRRLVLTPGKARRTAVAYSAAASRTSATSVAVAAGNSGEEEEGGVEWDRGSRCSSNASSCEVLAAAAERTSSGSGRPETEVIDDGSETTACNYDGGDVHRWRERTPSSEMREREPDNLEPTARPAEHCLTKAAAASPASATPSEAEIEAFFAAAELPERERFAQKYNYDVVNDVPLQGRYEWVQIKP